MIFLVFEKFDLFLSKIGNVMVMRRIFYIMMMFIIVALIIASDRLSNGKVRGLNGLFSDYDFFL